MPCNTPTMTGNAASMTRTARPHHLRQPADDIQHSNDQRHRAPSHLQRRTGEEMQKANNPHH